MPEQVPKTDRAQARKHARAHTHQHARTRTHAERERERDRERERERGGRIKLANWVRSDTTSYNAQPAMNYDLLLF